MVVSFGLLAIVGRLLAFCVVLRWIPCLDVTFDAIGWRYFIVVDS